VFKSDEESLLLVKNKKQIDVSRVIYDLISCCIKGDIKKDALVSILAELSVSSSGNQLKLQLTFLS
jgi:hypothetical protein